MDLGSIKGNIWIINAIPIIIIQIIAVPFYLFGDIFGVLMYSLLFLPVILTIINYKIGILRLKLKFGRILLITLLASTFSFSLFYIPPFLINLFLEPLELDKIGFAWIVIFLLFTLIYTLLLGLISYGFYKNFQKNDKLEGLNSLINIYEGTSYMVEFFKATLDEKKIDNIIRQLSSDNYGLFVEKKDIEIAHEIIAKTAGNTA
jgi:hypothetical protein